MSITDLTIYERRDGGDLNLVANDIESIKGLTNQAYLALFGGNSDGSEWWGAYLENTENALKSSFEKELKNNVLTSSGIIKLENAAKKDLKYLEKYANITVEGFLVKPGRVRFEITLQKPNELSEKLIFVWDGTQAEIINNNAEPLFIPNNLIFVSGFNINFLNGNNMIATEII